MRCERRRRRERARPYDRISAALAAMSPEDRAFTLAILKELLNRNPWMRTRAK